MTQYRIQCEYLEPNSTAKGAGQWHDSKKSIEETITYYNDKYKGVIYHWIESK